MNAVERFANVLGPVLAQSGEWTRQTTDLAPSTPSAILFTHTRRVALLLVPGDNATPAMVRTDLVTIHRRAAPKTLVGQQTTIPWSQVIVLLVFQHGASLQMRTFLQGEWYPVTPRQTVQSGWVDLKHGLCSFRLARTPFEVSLLAMLEDAASKGLLAQRAAEEAEAVEAVAPSASKKGGVSLFLVLALLVAAVAAGYVLYKPAGGKAPRPKASSSARHQASPDAAQGNRTSRGRDSGR